MQKEIDYHSLEDTKLWELMRHADMRAIEVLYKRHYGLLINFGMKYYGDEEFVKDCVQDLFVKLCSSSRLSPTNYVRSYLLTSLKHLLLDKLATLHPMEDITEISFEIKTDDSLFEMLFKQNDEDLALGRKLLEAYNQLTENQRMAIYLRFVKGLSYKEIATLLDINLQSSMNLVSRALSALRVHIGLKEFLLLLSAGGWGWM